ncbi:hypothetical protein [Acinetobacter stercoris]|uniref:Uncharacterized protein n=1 Tax=Acinetobacter stercoris TaxID=2126983 RepID=A0A2U3MZR9_9GAMM|nr:hypothetical protein [Acinetobacter stercoris]SPL70918.1 hypothetical protein KPC_2096 [Acinetobacter stercoris]
MNKRKEHFKKIRLVSIIVMGMIISIPLTTTHAQLQIPENVHISPIQLSQLTYNLKSNLAQRNLSNKELNLYQQLYSIANDSSQLYDPAIQHPSEQYENIRKKIHQQFDTVKQLAIQTYGSNANQKILLATNAFILMYYDALSRDNPKFFWPNLGVFVANDVRSNYALTFSLSNALDPLKISNDQEIIIAGKNIPTLQSIISHANQLLIEGQANVMADIGGLSILHQHYDSSLLAEKLVNYGTNLQEAFRLQKLADDYAQKNGIANARFKKLATDAAITFGIHEQEKILQPMWDKPLMQEFAKINDFMLTLSIENIGLRGDIFIGVNKFKLILSPYLIIRAPYNATNLASLNDRIAIARNGFTVLNNWKQNILYSSWIPRYQTQIGRGEGLYEPVGIK